MWGATGGFPEGVFIDEVATPEIEKVLCEEREIESLIKDILWEGWVDVYSLPKV